MTIKEWTKTIDLETMENKKLEAVLSLMATDFEAIPDEGLSATLSTIYNIKNARREALRSRLVKNLKKAWEDIEKAGFEIETNDEKILRFSDLYIPN